MSKIKMGSLFRRGKRTSFKYRALDHEGGYTFNSVVAYGQVNQILDMAAQDPKNADRYVKVIDRWLHIIGQLEEESSEVKESVGFKPPVKEDINDDESNE